MRVSSSFHCDTISVAPLPIFPYLPVYDLYWECRQPENEIIFYFRQVLNLDDEAEVM
jgi:hypothetical protein